MALSGGRLTASGGRIELESVGGGRTVRARAVEMIGFVPQTNSSNVLTADARPGSTGNAGNLTIETGTLRVLDGGLVSAKTVEGGKQVNDRGRVVLLAGIPNQQQHCER